MSNNNAVVNGLPRMITDITKTAANGSQATVRAPKLPQMPPEFAYGGEWMDPQWKKDARDYKGFFTKYPIQMALLLLASTGLAFGLACAKGACYSPGDAEAAGCGCGSSQTEQADGSYGDGALLGGDLSEPEGGEPSPPSGNDGLFGAESAVSGAIRDYDLAINGFRLLDGYDGDACIMVEFDFTNNGSIATAFYLSLMPQAYQDGVQLEEDYGMTEEFNNQEMIMEVQPGATFTVHKMFKLRSDTSPVQLKVSDLQRLSSETVETTFEISGHSN